MRRGELYRVRRPPGGPKPARVFVIVGRQALIDSIHSTVICAPVLSQYHGLPTQVGVGISEGLKHGALIVLQLSRAPETAAAAQAPKRTLSSLPATYNTYRPMTARVMGALLKLA